MHGSMKGAPCQQVDARSFEFAGTRPAKHKTQALFFDEPMHLIEQVGQSLHFIDDYPTTYRDCTHFIRKLAGICQQPLIGAFGQKIDNVSIGKSGPQPGTLAGAARAHQKKALLWGFKYSFQQHLITMSSFFQEI